MQFVFDFLRQEVPKSGKNMPPYYRKALFITELLLSVYFLLGVVLVAWATGRVEWVPIVILVVTVLALLKAGKIKARLNLAGIAIVITGVDVIANVEGKLAPVFYVREGATFNLYGGNLTCTKVSSEAGVGTVYKSTMNMYDGRLYGGSVNQKGGGNLAIFSSGTFNMYGGIIEGGRSTVTGGNVYSNSTAATFRMLGGTITGGEAVHGSGVSLIGKAILGGSAVITGNVGDDLYLEKNQKITIESDLTEQAICIALASGTGVFTDGAPEGAENWFEAVTGYAVQRTADGKLELINA